VQVAQADVREHDRRAKEGGGEKSEPGTDLHCPARIQPPRRRWRSLNGPARVRSCARPRDGYNLLLCTHFESINAAVYKSVAYKLADLAPVSQVSRYYYGVVAANDVPARDWEAFVAYARANPGKLNYGTIGKGSAQHILALELGKLTGTEMVGVPYKGGADALNDVLAGRVQMYVSPTLAVLPP
jgi:tripartite-type tricarboxylate transporter receptor subunit TctC